MKKMYEILGLKITENISNLTSDTCDLSDDDAAWDETPEKENELKYKEEMKMTSKLAYDFYSIFPVIQGDGMAKDSKIFESQAYNRETFIKAIDETHCVLVNFDRLDNVYENNIEITKDGKLIIEVTDPQAYNIAVYTPRGERHKRVLQSKEFAFIMEFYNQTRGNVWLKYKEKNIIKL